MNIKTKYNIGEEVAITVSAGYMGRDKKARVGKIINIIEDCNKRIVYVIETKTEKGRKSILNRWEEDLTELTESNLERLLAIVNKLTKKLSKSEIAKFLSPDEIAYLNLKKAI